MRPVPVGRITEILRRRENDLVWRVRRKGRKGQAGEWLYVYVMLEFQSTVDPRMAVRIMAYMGLFYDDLTRSLNWKPSQKLPPVVAVVLYNGRKCCFAHSFVGSGPHWAGERLLPERNDPGRTSIRIDARRAS